MPLHPPPHVRLTLQGDLPDGEMFSCSVSLIGSDDDSVDAPNEAVNTSEFASDLGAVCRDAATGFWLNETNGIHARAVLKRVKLAPIGADGLYSGPPREYAVNTVPFQTGIPQHPHQMARKVTLETDADLGRIKGGFYLPLPHRGGWSETTNLYDAESTANVRNAVNGFLNNLEDGLGLLNDISWFVVIASAGRHNKDGSLRVAPGLHKVKRVNVGRRIDVIRRRANKLSEARIADVALAVQDDPH